MYVSSLIRIFRLLPGHGQGTFRFSVPGVRPAFAEVQGESCEAVLADAFGEERVGA